MPYMNNGSQRHTEAMQDIISKRPSWAVRWGITLFFFLIAGAAGVSLNFAFPDTAKGKMVFVRDGGSFYGLLTITESNIEKVKEGQEVRVRLKNYPADNSKLAGRVVFVTNAPAADGSFLAKVKLAIPAGMVLGEWVKADGEAITSNQSMFYRARRLIFRGLN